MSQRPDNTVDTNIIQMKLGDLSALYAVYKNLELNAAPHIRDQISPNEVKLLQYVDAHPKLQQLLQEYKAQQDAIKQIDATQPRIWHDGTTSTRQWHDEQQARQNFLEGLDNATSGILGAFGQVLGQYLFPDDPAMANRVGRLGAIAGDITLNIADIAGGLRHETKEYIPNPTKKDLYSKEEHPYSERLSVHPKKFTAPWEKGIPGAFPYNYNAKEDVGHETEVVGEHIQPVSELGQPSAANTLDMGYSTDKVQTYDGSQYYNTNSPHICIPPDAIQPNQCLQPPELNQCSQPPELNQCSQPPELNQCYLPNEENGYGGGYSDASGYEGGSSNSGGGATYLA